MTPWVSWAPGGAAVLHIVEEFVLPGGFPAWDRRYRPGFEKSITPRLHIIVNGLLLVVCYDVGAMGLTPYGIALWLTIATLLATNGIWHLIGAYRTRSYSPGMITGGLLYVPLAVYGYVRFLRSGEAPVPTAVAAFVVGASYHLWVGKAIHRWRTGRAKNP